MSCSDCGSDLGRLTGDALAHKTQAQCPNCGGTKYYCEKFSLFCSYVAMKIDGQYGHEIWWRRRYSEKR